MKKLIVASMIAAAFGIAQAAAQQADVVVIGAGGAGMAAAVEAHDDGAKVILLEKMAMVGGNTTRATGGINACGTPQQAKLGIKDSCDLMFMDGIKGGHYLNNPQLLHVLTVKSADAVAWLIKLGGDFNDVGIMGGSSVKRTHRPTGGAAVGPEVVKTLYNAVQERKIDLRTNTKVLALVQDKKTGAITGVKVRDEENKKDYTIKAKAVVNAAGGFGANNAMVAHYVPKLKGFATTNQPGATGDGIVISEKVGADFVDMDQIQAHPTVVETNGTLVTEAVRGNGAILVNTKGQRFINELQTRDVVAAAVLKQPTNHAFLLFDDKVRKSLKAIESYVKSGIVLEGKTPEEIAQKIGAPADALKATLAAYKSGFEAKKDALGRADMESAIDQAPYYAIRITPAVHHTMGGVKINTKTEVINTKGKVIPGYYAAGEVTGGVHGGNRLGGNAQADIIVFGRIAGDNAAAYAKAAK